MWRGRQGERTATRREPNSKDNPVLKPESPGFAHKLFKTPGNLTIPTLLCTDMLEAGGIRCPPQPKRSLDELTACGSGTQLPRDRPRQNTPLLKCPPEIRKQVTSHMGSSFTLQENVVERSLWKTGWLPTRLAMSDRQELLPAQDTPGLIQQNQTSVEMRAA